MDSTKIINEKQFFEDYERCKKIIDAGETGYFILAGNNTFSDVIGMEKILLTEIEECYGRNFIPFLRFAIDDVCSDKDSGEYLFTYRIRRTNDSDRKRFRGVYRSLPPGCWVWEFANANGDALILPFIQKNDGSVVFLCELPAFRCDKSNRYKGALDGSTNKELLMDIIRKMPWYSECVFALVNYKGVDIAIPLANTAAKKTFKNRERDESGIKRRLIHNVSEHSRINLRNENSVRSHIRGESDLTINGVDITLAASWEWSEKILKSTERKK